MLNSKQATIVANGELSKKTLLENVDSSSLTIATDGAIKLFYDTCLSPDLVLGDLDSSTPQQREKTRTLYRPSQEETDLMKAVDYLYCNGISDIKVLGATGKRADFTLFNLRLLVQWHYKYPNLSIKFIDDYGIFYLISSSFSFSGAFNQKVSILSIGGESVITTKGLKWELEEALFDMKSLCSISNQIKEPPCSVQIKGDPLLLYLLNEIKK
jgi:thiamine pyrophosphokinase